MPADLNGVILLKGYRFRIAFTGGDSVELAAAYANEVSGLDAEFDVVEYRAGDDMSFTVHKYPGLAKYGNVTIKQCLMQGGLDFYETVGKYLGGTADHSNDKFSVEISLLGDDSEVAATWTLTNAWVTKYTGPDLNSTSSEISVETIELAHEGLTRTA